MSDAKTLDDIRLGLDGLDSKPWVCYHEEPELVGHIDYQKSLESLEHHYKDKTEALVGKIETLTNIIKVQRKELKRQNNIIMSKNEIEIDQLKSKDRPEQPVEGSAISIERASQSTPASRKTQKRVHHYVREDESDDGQKCYPKVSI
jgi:hypothetical protein